MDTRGIDKDDLCLRYSLDPENTGTSGLGLRSNNRQLGADEGVE